MTPVINDHAFNDTGITSVNVQNTLSPITISITAFPSIAQISYKIYTIPNTVTSFNGSGILNTNNIIAVNFQSGSHCTAIANNAFQNWTALVSIDFSNSIITSIGVSSFQGCASLLNFTLPNTVTSIGNYAFLNCTSLTTFDMTNNTALTSIGVNAFDSCTSLTTLHFPDNAGYCFLPKENSKDFFALYKSKNLCFDEFPKEFIKQYKFGDIEKIIIYSILISPILEF